MKQLLVVFFLSIFTSYSYAAKPTLYNSQVLTSSGLFHSSVEGPAVDQFGNLYAVNFSQKGTIGIVPKGKNAELWLTLPQGSVGNSIRFNKEGQMFVADYKGHNVFTVDVKSKKLTLLFHEKEMNQPNDMAISKNGTIYLSDPNWKIRKNGSIWIYKNSKIQLAATGLAAVNGIDITPDENRLFFSESISGNIFSMDIKDGMLINKKIFCRFQPDTVDGIRFDSAGNLFVARIQNGKIDIISPKAKKLRSVTLHGKSPTNLAFGGPDGKTVYVTLRDKGTIESFRTEYAGREHFSAK